MDRRGLPIIKMKRERENARLRNCRGRLGVAVWKTEWQIVEVVLSKRAGITLVWAGHDIESNYGKRLSLVLRARRQSYSAKKGFGGRDGINGTRPGGGSRE